jgi:hypothetical protein
MVALTTPSPEALRTHDFDKINEDLFGATPESSQIHAPKAQRKSATPMTIKKKMIQSHKTFDQAL